MLPHTHSRLLLLLPSYSSHTSPTSYTHTPNPSHSKLMSSHSDQQPCPSNSASLPSCSTPSHLFPQRAPLSAYSASSSYWPGKCFNLSVTTQSKHHHSSPTLMQSDDVSACTGLTLEQPTSSPLLPSASNQPRPASPRDAWQQGIWPSNRYSRPFDSGVSSLRSNSFMTGVSHFSEELPLPPSTACHTHTNACCKFH